MKLNLSCPHVAKVGLEVGDDLELVKKIVTTVKNASDVPVIAKVGLGDWQLSGYCKGFNRLWD